MIYNVSANDKGQQGTQYTKAALAPGEKQTVYEGITASITGNTAWPAKTPEATDEPPEITMGRTGRNDETLGGDFGFDTKTNGIVPIGNFGKAVADSDAFTKRVDSELNMAAGQPVLPGTDSG